MKYDISCRIYGMFYHNACKKILGEKGVGKEEIHSIQKEYQAVVERASSIGKSKLLSAYLMAAYFIAMNRCDGLSSEENYEVLNEGLKTSKIFKAVLGNADSYLDPKKLQGRIQWSRETHEKKYENEWVVDIIEGDGTFDLGYDYHACGVCALCRDEGCPEYAKYLCRLDYMMAELMGMELERTTTIAEGGTFCDFRYRKKSK